MTGNLDVRLLGGRRTSYQLLVVGVFEGEPLEGDHVPEETRAALSQSSQTASFGKSGWVWETALEAQRRLLVRGLGKRAELSAGRLRSWVGGVVDAACTREVERLALVLPDHDETATAAGIAHLVASLHAAAYRFTEYLSEPGSATLRTMALCLGADSTIAREGLELGRAVAAGATVTRTLANTPPNVATPEWMASRARALARRHGGTVEVLAPTELRRRGMGGILAVGGGSAQSPRMVRWRRGNRGPKVALVGKGVTFDTGGISIKPAAAMDEMKYDKCGACTVLGAMVAAADLALPLRLSAYLPFAENMPDAAAYRPGDIVRCYNGKTVEIINTDAEGRMILADALSWAASEKPSHMVELSTLTGATVVALGSQAAALYTRDDSLAAALEQAAASSRERVWRMPLWREFGETMKGNHADLRNSGERWGGANAAAAFLAEFTGDVASWAHLDIAGTAYSDKPVSRSQHGATGHGVGLLTTWLRAVAAAG